jgi:hypothetical protein
LLAGHELQSNCLADLLPLVPRILQELTRIRVGEIRRVEAEA